MMREYSITTSAGSCTPQKTAEPSIAGVKKGRPAMMSTIRNQSATTPAPINPADRKSTRLNSSHGYISYAVFCLKKKKERQNEGNSKLEQGKAARQVTNDSVTPLSH